MSVTPFWSPIQFSKVDGLISRLIQRPRLRHHFTLSSPYSWHALWRIRVWNSCGCYLYPHGIPVYSKWFPFIPLHIHAIRLSREHRDKIETYLAFGATRVEACRPMAIQALKLALMPQITNMR